MKNKVEELSKILADRYGHGMAEKCVTQAEVALEVLGDRIIQLEQDYNEVARDNRYMSLRTSELLCELAETKELVERLEQERNVLKAQYARLDAGAYGLMCDRTSNDRWYELDEIRNTTPAQSLAEIQAQAIEPVLLDKYEYFDEHGKYTVVDVEDIKYRIQQLLEDT